VFRWRPVAPGGFGHYSDADNVYKGFYIPKKTLVIPLIWAMHRDPSVYDDPHTFEPKRFLGRGELDSAEVITSGHHAFG
jgi:cytochrome P450